MIIFSLLRLVSYKFLWDETFNICTDTVGRKRNLFH